MIYPVELLLPPAGTNVTASSYYEVLLESLSAFNVLGIMDAWLRLYNTTCTDCKLRITTTAAVSGVFSDTITQVNDVAVPINSSYSFEFGLPLVKGARVSHTVRIINNDLADRRVYFIVGGWTSINTTLSTYVGAV